MKLFALLIATMFFSLSALAADGSKEKPTQHLKVPDVTSMAQAKEIFIGSTAQINGKKTPTLKDAAEVHVMTYTLEKSIAYFVENLTDEKQVLAKQIAVVVEDMHISSENNRLEELSAHIGKYAALANKFLFCF